MASLGSASAAAAVREKGMSSRLARGKHDWIPEELEGDGAEEALGRPSLHGRCVQVPFAEAIVSCTSISCFGDMPSRYDYKQLWIYIFAES